MPRARLDIATVRALVATYPTICADVAAEIRNMLQAPLSLAYDAKDYVNDHPGEIEGLDHRPAMESIARLRELADALAGNNGKRSAHES